MPELPEVETCRRGLEPHLVGRRICEVRTGSHNGVFLTPASVLKRRLAGATVTRIDRIGKYLLLRFETGALLVHLGMTGFIGAADGVPDTHRHLTLTLDNSQAVVFRDPRTFGKLQWLSPSEEHRSPRLNRLGPDALSIEPDRLYDALHSRRVSVKTILLDQSVYAGIGNIYADEACFRAGVRPMRAGKRVSRVTSAVLAQHVRLVLERAIERGGSSISDFLSPTGDSGYFQIEHAVYGRAGQPCLRCGASIRKAVHAQRGTHWCPKCQT